ncbi:MAG: hypothetical protein JXL97_13425 [Bacteroidales bacterium]|nr:hypothetical protein [Bacteroidales bacterium]
MKKLKLFLSAFLLLSLLMNSSLLKAQQVTITDDGAYTPHSSALLDVHAASGDMGILVPKVVLDDASTAAPVTGPATGLMIYSEGGAESDGFYFWTGSQWNQLYSGSVPTVPGNTEYWIRPPASSYIHPEHNTMIKVYDAGQTYGVFYDGGTNQYGVYARTTDITDPTAAVVGFSDVAGNQTYGYLGYNGTYSFGNPVQTINGSSVYGVAEDPSRTAGFFRSTLNASVAANINFSDVWIASYNYVQNGSNLYNPPGLYAQLNVSNSALGGNQVANKGFSMYTAASGNNGYTIGTQGIAVGYSQDAVGIYGYSYSSTAGINYVMEGSGSTGAVGFAEHSGTTVTLDAFMFGVIGEKYQDYSGSYYYDERSGGVLGTMLRVDDGSIQVWGSLGYKASNATNYGLFYSANVGTGGGKTNTIANGIGIGGTADLMAGWMKGEIYGLTVKGERYGLYVDGKQYANDVITELSDNGSDERIATYVPTSTSVDIISKGTTKLSNGKAIISFDENFSNVVSQTEPIIVTVTPQGKTQGVYVETVKNSGFVVVENNNGKSTTTISWIAIGTKKGYENPQNPVELLAKDYDINMNNVMFNESDTENSAQPIWWDGQKLRFDEMPRDTEQNRVSKSIILPKKISKEDFIKETTATKK